MPFISGNKTKSTTFSTPVGLNPTKYVLSSGTKEMKIIL